MTRESVATRPNSRLRVHAVKGVFWTAASNWGDQLSRLLVFMILARLLDPKAFGLVALAWVFTGLTDLIAEVGLVDALIQRRHATASQLSTAFWTTLVVGVVLMVSLMGLSLPLGSILHEDSLAPVLVGLSLVIPIGSLSHVQRAILNRNLAFRPLALRTLLGTGVGSVVGVGAALAGFGVWSLVAQRVVAELTATVVLWRVTEWRPSFTYSWRDARDLLGFGMHVVGVRVLNFVNSNSDNLIVGAVLGTSSLGLYTVGYRILRLVIQITSNLIDGVAFPIYSRLQDNRIRLSRAYYKSSTFAALLAFPGFTFSLIMAPQLIDALFGQKWAGSVPVMRVLSVAGLVISVNALNSDLLLSLGKASWRMKITSVTTVLNLSAFVIGVQFGIVGVAAGAAVVAIGMAPVSYWAVSRLMPLHPFEYAKRIWAPAVASAVFAATLALVRHVLGDTPDWLVLAACGAAGTIVYAAMIRLLAPPVAGEAIQLSGALLPGRRRRRARAAAVDDQPAGVGTVPQTETSPTRA